MGLGETKRRFISKMLSCILVALIFVGGFPISASVQVSAGSQHDQGGDYVPSQVIVGFQSGFSTDVQNSAISSLNATVLRTSALGAQLLSLPAGMSPYEAVEVLERNPVVRYAEPNYIVRTALVQDQSIVRNPGDEPWFNDQWGLFNVNASAAWNLFSSPGAPVTVAVLDTGVDATHVELDDGRVLIGRNFTNSGMGPNDTGDVHGHGTHVTGIITSEINGMGITGIAGNANVDILPVKVLGDDGSGDWFWVADGIAYAADRASDIINMSLGGPFFSQAVADAVIYAQNRGALLVAAAGNDVGGPVGFPAALPNVLAISATDSLNGLALFSNVGPQIDLAAPGHGILSLLPGNSYALASGTSMAAPMVAGAAALLLAADPMLTAQALTVLLTENARDLGTPGFDNSFGHGLLDLHTSFLDNIRVTGVSVTPETAMVSIGASLQLNVSVLPANATNRNVTWSSSNPAIATVDASGLVRGVGAGSATITAMTADGGFMDTSVVSVIVPVTGISVMPETAMVSMGASLQLNVSVLPANATNRNVTWSSSNPAAATVDVSGLVRGVGAGSATITATTADGGFMDTSVVSVIVPVTGISVTPEIAMLNMGASLQLNAAVLPANATNRNVIWSSSNPAIATVDQAGLVRGVMSHSI